jgi:hypothetical protein
MSGVDPFLRIEAGPNVRQPVPPPSDTGGHLARRYLAVVAAIALAALLFMIR